ncbi:MAG: sulfatase-like hydrolase/transferase [Pseudomonadota bacterium]
MSILRSLSMLALVAFTMAQGTEARDNFLVILADDLGVDAVGVYSRDDLYGHPGEGASPGPTPWIDQLAANGILFRNAYSSPTCAPTRASTLTGRFPFRIGIGEPEGAQLSIEETLLPEVLASTHRNGVAGKWHIGNNSDIDHPIDSGFDAYAGPLSGSVPSYFSWPKTTNSSTSAGSTQSGFATYVTTDNVNEAIDLINGFGDEPWFVWLAFTAPHTPFHAPPAALISADVNDQSPAEDLYRAAVEAMDTEIGRLLQAIPAAVLADTTIFFVGDNGSPRRAVVPPFVASRAKGTVYEGGVNVPFIVQSPWIDPADEGSESLALVHTLDIFATLTEIAGQPNPAEDSVSLLPYLQDPTLPTRSSRPYAYAERFSPNGEPPYDTVERAIRGERFKLIWRDGVDEELFDLSLDPFEAVNLLLSLPLEPDAETAFNALSAAMETLHTSSIFRNGFESGGVDAWSAANEPDRTDAR